MLKTVKGKVIAGTVAVTLFAGAGVAFGASDAGTNLQTWFKSQFTTAKADMKSDVQIYANEQKEVLKAEFNTLKQGATNDINGSKESSSLTAITNIDNELDKHIGSIDTKKVEIEGYMTSQFATILENAEDKIYDAGTEYSKKASDKMYEHTGEVGSAALETLNTELTKKKDEALEELRVAIETAKSELQTQLNDQTYDTTEEIKDLIDTRVGEVRIWVTFMTDFAIQEQEEAIDTKALELENAAKTAMQGLIDGI
ncbi:hypothetical protein MKY37_12000 [Psychrobacillus sp. FSL K6-2836]|uniref:hypothetical protein n=1 Tax=Psychrobacillus sp. FSL K6-2836 TaxID=2921548 RepID=UPI0030FC1B1F